MDEKDGVTWEQILDRHFKGFTDGVWNVFNAYMTEILEKEYGMDKMKFRDYVIWDMKRRHDEEVKEIK